MRHMAHHNFVLRGDYKRLPFETRWLTLLLLAACGGGGSGGSRQVEVSTSSVRLVSSLDETQATDGNDVIYLTASRSEPVNAAKGDDVILGQVGNDTFYGDEGDDVIFGFGGHDTIYGGQGSDYIWGEDGIDRLYGNQGDDVILAGAGDDFVTGGDGHDVLHAGSGDDALFGDTGNDVLVYLYRNSTASLTGGAGSDLFLIQLDNDDRNSAITITDFDNEEDHLIYPSILEWSRIENGNTYFRFADTPNGADVLILENIALQRSIFSTIPGEVADSDDIIRPDSPNLNNALLGTNDDDQIELGGGNDFATAENGDDVVRAGDGNDYVAGYDGNDTLYGGNGIDHLYGQNGNDVLYGDAGQDYLSGGNGDDELKGGDGNDDLSGGAGNDELDGGAGNDYLDGGAGRDTLTGGAGSDIFSFDYDDISTDADIITDFEVGIDRLEFVQGFETDEQDFDIAQSGGNTTIYYTGSGRREVIVTLEGVTDGVNFDDFLFYFAEVA